MQLHRWAASALIIVIVILSSCSQAGRFLLYIDPYQFEILSGQGVDATVMRQSLPKDLNIRVEVSATPVEAEEALKRFAEVIERTRPAWVYLSAAHPFDPAGIVSRYPDIRFIREGIPDTGPANQITLVYDREEANYRAGMAIAALLENAEFLDRIGQRGASHSSTAAVEPRVGILTAVRSEAIQRESAAFVEGFSRFGSPERVEIRDIGNLTDRVRARRLLEEMKEEEVAIVFLKTYVLSGFCLDYLAKESGVAIVEGPVSDRAYGDTVLLMLVDDFVGALQQMADIVDQGSEGLGIRHLSAPVDLRWGGAYRSLADEVLDQVLAEESSPGVDQQGENRQ